MYNTMISRLKVLLTTIEGKPSTMERSEVLERLAAAEDHIASVVAMTNQPWTEPPEELVGELKSCEEQLREFIASNAKNAWLSDPTMEVYVRRFRGRLEIANVGVADPGKGRFTRFLEVAETLVRVVHIENVLNARFGKFFERRGYNRDAFANPPCYTKEV